MVVDGAAAAVVVTVWVSDVAGGDGEKVGAREIE